MVNSSRFASDPQIDKPWGSTLREKLPRSVRLRYVNWGSKECQQGDKDGSRGGRGSPARDAWRSPALCWSSAWARVRRRREQVAQETSLNDFDSI